jgi:hypothetical protein
MNFLATLVTKKLAIDFAIKLINTITSSTNGISSLVNTIKSYKHSNNICLILKQTDIEMSMKILKILISEINIKDNCTVTLLMSLVSLSECLNDIEKELHIINTKSSYNKSLWISWKRAYEFEENENNLILLKTTLDMRKEFLFSVVKINDHLTKNENAMIEMNKYMKEFHQMHNEQNVSINGILFEKELNDGLHTHTDIDVTTLINPIYMENMEINNI